MYKPCSMSPHCGAGTTAVFYRWRCSGPELLPGATGGRTTHSAQAYSRLQQRQQEEREAREVRYWQQGGGTPGGTDPQQQEPPQERQAQGAAEGGPWEQPAQPRQPQQQTEEVQQQEQQQQVTVGVPFADEQRFYLADQSSCILPGETREFRCVAPSVHKHVNVV